MDETPPQIENAPAAPTPWTTLTDREMEVAFQLSRGDTNREISQALGISIKTVDTHRHNLLVKLGIKNNVGLARYMIREGRVTP